VATSRGADTLSNIAGCTTTGGAAISAKEGSTDIPRARVPYCHFSAATERCLTCFSLRDARGYLRQ